MYPHNFCRICGNFYSVQNILLFSGMSTGIFWDSFKISYLFCSRLRHLIWNSTLLTGCQAIAGDIVYSVSIRRTSASYGGEYSGVHEIHALNASTGNEEGNYTLFALTNPQHKNFPVIANGAIYISQNGEFGNSLVFCLGSAQSSSNSSPEPISTPYQEPQQIESVILGVAITVAVLAISLGLLIYLIKRK